MTMMPNWEALWNKTIKESSSNKRIWAMPEREKLNQSAEILYKMKGRQTLQNNPSKMDRFYAELNRLKRLITPDSTVLDIGAGTGRLAIPMAKMVKKVTAIEPASTFMTLLRDNAEQERIDNMEFVESLWSDFQPQEKYDLVYSTWSGAIRDPASLMKMHEVCRCYCFLEVGASPDRLWEFYGKIYPLIMGENFQPSGNYLNILTTLYEHGISANLETWDSESELNYIDMANALDAWERGLSEYIQITEMVREQLRQYYQSQMNLDGSYTYPVKGVSCAIWWKVLA